MTVLKYIPKSGQTELTEHLQKEMKLVTQGQAKYYNRLYKFFLQTDVMSSEDIDYEMRERYIEWIKQEDISEKYRAELIRLFDRMKIENMPDIQTQGVPFAVTQDFFQKDKWFLLYVPNKQKARTFRQVVNKEELLWDFSTITIPNLKKQAKTILCEILNMPIAQRMRRRYLEPLKILISFCQTQGIDDIEEMDAADENRFYMYISQRSKEIRKQGSMIVEFSRRTLFLADSDTNWNAGVWYLERFRFDMSRVNASVPIRSISFTKIQIRENRKNLQLYGKYLVGISDMAISNIRTTIGFLTQFLLYMDDRGMELTELVAEDIRDYAVYLGTTDIKYSTVNRYIMSIHTFFQFLQMKKVDVPQFYPEQYLQKGYSEHNDRSVPERTVVQILNALPTFPEHLQLMYLILLCTGIRKSEVCTIKGGAFYKQNGEFWLRIYQPKMRRDKVIPVPSTLLEIVKEYEKKNGIKVEEYIFKNARGNAFNGQTFSNQMIEECEKRDINCGEYVFRAHDYRHSIATTMHEKGVAIQGIRDYLGHSSENMTKQYIDFMPEHITKAENKYFTKNQSFTLKGAEKNEK